jgi:hypothetical protein
MLLPSFIAGFVVGGSLYLLLTFWIILSAEPIEPCACQTGAELDCGC